MGIPTYSNFIRDVSMILFRTQSEYNTFNKNLSDVFDVDYIEQKLEQSIVENVSKRVLGFEFQKNNQFGKMQKGVPKSKEHREKLRLVNLGKKMSEESSQKKRQSMLGKIGPNKGKKLTDEWKNNMSVAGKGKPKSDAHKKSLGSHLNNLPQLECPYCGITGRNAPMKRWHFENCKKAIKS